MEVANYWGVFCESPYKDHSMLGSIVGPPYLCKPHMSQGQGFSLQDSGLPETPLKEP